MSYIGGAGALVLETQSVTGSWLNGFASTSDPVLGTVIGLNDDLIPSADIAFDIGTNLKRVRVLHTAKINDNVSGETLEIGNYTADTGVTGVYGQLQGKNACWTLAADGTGSALGSLNRFTINAGSQIYMKPVTGAAYLDTDYGMIFRNRANTYTVSFYPAATVGGSGGIDADGAFSISTGGNFWVSSPASATIDATTACAISSSGTMALTGSGAFSLGSSASSVTVSSATALALTAAASAIYCNSDLGVTVRNNATTHAVSIVAASTGSTLTTSGTGNTSITLATPTVTLGNQTTATCNISAGSASASTTTTNIGCAVAGSTNTINIGRIAANDVATVSGTLVRSAEHVQAFLTASYLFTGGGDHTLPSLSTLNTNNRYLIWDDASHGFQNTHPTKTLVVYLNATVPWSTSLNVRSIRWFCSGPAADHGHQYWNTGDALSKTASAVIPVTAGQWIYPIFNTTVTNEVITGGSNVFAPRLSLYATVI